MSGAGCCGRCSTAADSAAGPASIFIDALQAVATAAEAAGHITAPSSDVREEVAGWLDALAVASTALARLSSVAMRARRATP